MSGELVLNFSFAWAEWVQWELNSQINTGTQQVEGLAVWKIEMSQKIFSGGEVFHTVSGDLNPTGGVLSTSPGNVKVPTKRL